MRRNKYGAIKTTVDGITFHSKKEAAHYQDLKLRVRKGEIKDLILQPKFPLVINGVKCGSYIGDFEYVEGGRRVIVDVKGVKTPVYNLKKKLVKAVHGVEVVEI